MTITSPSKSRRHIRWTASAAVLASVLSVGAFGIPAFASPATASAFTHTSSAATSTPSPHAVEVALKGLGLPTGRVTGSYNADAQRALCTWRTIEGRTPTRALPTASEARAILGTTALPRAAAPMINGVNVSITCQAAFWVEGGHYVRVMDGTTGKPGHATRLGTSTIFRSYTTWRGSTIYKGAMMYKPMQFNGGEALHGSATDHLVKTYPASHGCVRMLHRDIDALHAGGVGIGTKVRVFGQYVW